MVKIAFHDNQLCERGTTIAVYDYAYYNKHYLGNESIIMYDATNNHSNVSAVIEKFAKEFTLRPYNHWSEADGILSQEGCDILYMIKAGDWDGRMAKVCKNIIHCVFNTQYKHGDVYGRISSCFGKDYPVVSHIATLPDIDTNMRQELTIPDTAVVFGRHGGMDQFNISYVHGVIDKITDENPNIYFLFVNTDKFCKEKPNIIHLGKIIDLEEKTRFINSCDAMIHARLMGETFGSAVAEFSIRNKPVITCNRGHDIAHLDIMKDKCFKYGDAGELYSIFNQVYSEIGEIKLKDWNAHRMYSPEKVMDTFNEVFIRPCLIPQTNTVKFQDLKLEYFLLDLLGKNSIGRGECWEKHMISFFKNYTKKCKVGNIIDIGANFGFHSVMFSKLINGKVFSFEPQQQNYQLLLNNIKHNDIQNIVAYNHACGDSDTTVSLPIIPHNITEWNMGDFTPNIMLGRCKSNTVRSVILDNFDLPKIDFIKIDVQGWEKKVLSGLVQTLRKDKPILIVEFEEHQLSKVNCSSKELFDFIRGLDYYIFYLEFEYPCDHICVHNDNLKEFEHLFSENIYPHTTDNKLNFNYTNGVNKKYTDHFMYDMHVDMTNHNNDSHTAEQLQSDTLIRTIDIYKQKTEGARTKNGGSWDNLWKPGYLHGLWLQSNKNITTAVDIGCGSGWFVNYLIDEYKFEHVTGIEPSQAAIDIGIKICPNNAATNRVSYLCGHPEVELSKLALTEPTLFTTFIVLSRINDDSVIKILKEMNTVAPVGSVCIFNENYDTTFHQELWHCRSREWWKSHLPGWKVIFDERPRPDLNNNWKQGILGIKQKSLSV
jgi:FkbM family methyltransferase